MEWNGFYENRFFFVVVVFTCITLSSIFPFSFCYVFHFHFVTPFSYLMFFSSSNQSFAINYCSRLNAHFKPQFFLWFPFLSIILSITRRSRIYNNVYLFLETDEIPFLNPFFFAIFLGKSKRKTKEDNKPFAKQWTINFIIWIYCCKYIYYYHGVTEKRKILGGKIAEKLRRHNNDKN